MPSNSIRMRNAQRYDKLRDLMIARVEKAVGRPLHKNERLFIFDEVDQMIHRGDSSEPSLVAIAKQIKSMSASPAAPPPASGGGDGGSAVSDAIARSSGAAVPKKTPAGSGVSSVAPSALQARRIADEEVRQASAQGAGRTELPPTGCGGGGGGGQKKPTRGKESKPVLTSVSEAVSPHRRPLPHEEHKDDLWAAIARKEAQEFFAENLKQRREAKVKADAQRVVLDQQVAVRKKKSADARESDKLYIKEAERQKLLWEKEERQVEVERKKRTEDEHSTREGQLSVNRQRRAVEVVRRRLEGERAVAAAAAQESEERQTAEQRRVRSRDEVERFKQFNENEQRLRVAEAEREKLRDDAAEKTFLERLAKEEAAREAALSTLHEKMKIKEQIAFQIEASWKDKAVADEARAEAYALKIEQRKEADERAVKQKALDAKVKQRQYLQLQMLERDSRAKVERDRFEEERDGARRAAEAAETAEHERRVREKVKLAAHREALERQMLEHVSRREEHMTDTEKRLNRKHLAQAGCSV